MEDYVARLRRQYLDVLTDGFFRGQGVRDLLSDPQVRFTLFCFLIAALVPAIICAMLELERMRTDVLRRRHYLFEKRKRFSSRRAGSRPP